MTLRTPSKTVILWLLLILWDCKRGSFASSSRGAKGSQRGGGYFLASSRKECWKHFGQREGSCPNSIWNAFRSLIKYSQYIYFLNLSSPGQTNGQWQQGRPRFPSFRVHYIILSISNTARAFLIIPGREKLDLEKGTNVMHKCLQSALCWIISFSYLYPAQFKPCTITPSS